MSKGLKITLIVLLGAVLLCGVGTIGVYGYVNGLRDTAIDYETRLNAQYLDNQNELSAYVSGFYEQLNVANLKSDQLDRILTDAVKGRYDSESTAQPDSGRLFSAIVEAYPDLTENMALYDRILDYVQAHREAYKQKQSALLDVLRSFDRWRKSGFINSFIIKNILGIPDENLEARLGRQVWRGQEALDRMYVIILDSQSYEAYENGQLDPLASPGEPSASNSEDR